MTRKTIGISVAAAALVAVLAGTAIASEHGGHAGRMDPFGDKTVTRAEVQAHAAAMFAKHDGNADGKLDAADRAAHHGEMFEKLDTNKDGAVSRAEFDAAHQGVRHGDGDQSAGHGKSEHGGRMAMMMLHMADANKDRAVSKDEFVAAHAAMFDKADTDKDGKVTKAERQAAHAQMRGHMKGGHGDAAAGTDAHAGH